jgi:hypothetical protein
MVCRAVLIGAKALLQKLSTEANGIFSDHSSVARIKHNKLVQKLLLLVIEL